MSIPSWAKVGAKVVCVDDTPRLNRVSVHNGDFGGLTRGQIYTIRGYGSAGGYATLVLSEIDRGIPENGFNPARFRPVKTIEDDISEHFAQHLTVRGRAPVEMAS